jgi:Right handed beta helix region
VKNRLVAVVVLAGWAVACSSDDDGGVEPVNHAPSVEFIFDKIAVVQGSTADLSVDVADADGDPVTVTWTPTRGTIAYLNTEQTMARWSVPNTVGTDTITIDASDGTVTTRIKEAIKVGWPHSLADAPAVFQKSRSPYIVSLSGSPPILSVNGGATTIEAGTELLLETAATVIDVTDSLIVAGTLAEPVVIRPNVRHQTCGDDRGWWEGIKIYTDFPQDGVLDMNYGQVWYARYGVRLRDQGSARIRNSSIKCSDEAGVLHEGVGTLILQDSEVSNGRVDGIQIGGSAATLLPDSVLIDGCDIKLNGETALAMDLVDTFQEVPIVVQYTNFEFNAGHGITLAREVFPRIHYNRFFANGVGSVNGLNSIWLFNGYPGSVSFPVLDATCNFWGSSVSNPATIAGLIRDQADSGAVGTLVDFEPWLNADPRVTPPACP